MPLPGRSPMCAASQARRARSRRQPQHAEPQRVAGERAADRRHLDAAGAQLLGDVGHHPLVGGRGGREHRRAGRQRAQQVADAAVVGAEVVAPVGDAVRLVDDDEPAAGDQPGQLLLAEPRVGQPLGGDEQDVDVVGGEAGGDVVPLGHVGAGDLDGADAGAGRGGHLVAHQREQRADQQRRAGAAAAQEGGGDEVDGRLAPAGALHDQRPLRALDQRRDGGVLPLAEDRVGPAGQLAEDGERLVGDLGRRRSGAHGDDSRQQRPTERRHRADAGDGGGESTAMRPPDNHVHTGWSWDTPDLLHDAPGLRAGGRARLPAIAFTEHLDFTDWLANDRGDAPTACSAGTRRTSCRSTSRATSPS